MCPDAGESNQLVDVSIMFTITDVRYVKLGRVMASDPVHAGEILNYRVAVNTGSTIYSQSDHCPGVIGGSDVHQGAVMIWVVIGIRLLSQEAQIKDDSDQIVAKL